MKLGSGSRLLAVMIKEFIQMRRDKATFAMIIGIPLMQLILFGYAINTNPRDYPQPLLILITVILPAEF